MAEEVEIRCPYCGKPYNESKVVGKVRNVQKGIRSTYEVALCSCGGTFRGNVLKEEKLPPRKFTK
ncbi:MAG: hypothetical protein QF673_03950 [Candidatus Hydrothermarchaeota archaeon]|jgi:hypothetical protein|nr:hypothetical protein [Candidatus Hydrothermarchaeota archaeon]MDP6613152.1 hypothetical protein [Candidatus Hydrothermarchaeota archaeon]